MGRLSFRLLGWSLFVLAGSAVSYASQLSESNAPKDFAYRWEASISGLVVYSIFLGIALLIAPSVDRRKFLGFRAPNSWWRALRISLLIVIAVLVVGQIVLQFGNPEEEQGLIPPHWNSHRIAQFAAFTVVVVVVGPIVEEIMFRGVGYALLEPFGRWPAILVVGLAFGLIHGLFVGFPVIAAFGIGLAYLRSRTESLYPCILLHACFNAFQLTLGVTT